MHKLCSTKCLNEPLTNVTLEVKGETQLRNLANKLKKEGIDHKLWVQQPEDLPTCLTTRPCPKLTLEFPVERQPSDESRSPFQNHNAKSKPPPHPLATLSPTQPEESREKNMKQEEKELPVYATFLFYLVIPRYAVIMHLHPLSTVSDQYWELHQRRQGENCSQGGQNCKATTFTGKVTRRRAQWEQEYFLVVLRQTGRKQSRSAFSTSVAITVPPHKGQLPGALCVPSTFSSSPHTNAKHIALVA
ncbi:Peptidyl-tRNA hydrolase PTH2 [Musa troglodytarum]|uniref:peptidyl-tRNA hydrolase n=1 Tax=Musa troglodytarum TaxID=320322 RepID=A0A9E7F1R9_9LILI|nr:Peptidyl-tRNA hydrolase PTH2 [Musa troglodytarum]